MRAIREAEDDETREEILQQLQDYWESLFTDQLNQVKQQKKALPETGKTQIQTPALLNRTDLFQDVLIIYCENPGFISYYTDGFERKAPIL
jgi:hypothetical protein